MINRNTGPKSYWKSSWKNHIRDDVGMAVPELSRPSLAWQCLSGSLLLSSNWAGLRLWLPVAFEHCP
jgi:hypothetical protein